MAYHRRSATFVPHVFLETFPFFKYDWKKETVVFHEKKFHWGNVIGALIFGLGWALIRACPGPLFAQIGSGFTIVAVTLLSAVGGTWMYGLLRDRLPH